MNEPLWKYVDSTHRVVSRIWDNGHCESCLSAALSEKELASVLPEDAP